MSLKLQELAHLGQTSVSEIQPKVLPIGLYRVAVEFPSFAKHTNNNKTTSYVFGEKHSVHPKDKLSVHVGLDIPNVDDIEISLNEKTTKLQLQMVWQFSVLTMSELTIVVWQQFL